MAETKTKYTADKAWVGGAMTLLAHATSRYGLNEAPPIEDVAAALWLVGESALSFAIGYIMVWLKGNREKPAA